MPYVDVPDAKLYYETQGNGPLLVLVPAANGDTKLYEPALPYLAENFTVCAYDRRRFSRSKETTDRDYQGADRLARDADDLELLVKHLQPDRPAFIFGSSSGGLVALQYMERHASSVAGMIVHEAPVATLLDGEIAQVVGAQIGGVLGGYMQTQDSQAVIDWFYVIFPPEDKAVLENYWNTPENKENLTYWIERELAGYPPLQVDMEALKKNHDRMVIGLSKEMSETWLGPIADKLNTETGSPLITIPHGHMGYSHHPKEFAEAITKELQSRWA